MNRDEETELVAILLALDALVRTANCPRSIPPVPAKGSRRGCAGGSRTPSLLTSTCGYHGRENRDARESLYMSNDKGTLKRLEE
jgi:hypothetical protein